MKPEYNALEAFGIIFIGVILVIIWFTVEAKTRIRFRGRLGCLPYVVILMGVYFLGANIWSGISPASSPAPTRLPTGTPIVAKQSTTTPVPSKAPNLDFLKYGPTQENTDCYHWGEVTSAMVGRSICVYGNVYDLYSTEEASTRIKFSSLSNTFFIYSANYVFPDLRVGDCVVAKAKVQLFDSKVPYLSVDNLYKCEAWMGG